MEQRYNGSSLQGRAEIAVSANKIALQKFYGRSDPYYLYELEIVDTTAAPAVTEKFL